MESFAVNERVYVAPDADEAPPVLRGQSARVLQDRGDELVQLVFDAPELFGVHGVRRVAVRRERRGTWQRPVAYAEVPLPGDDPLGPPRLVPRAR